MSDGGWYGYPPREPDPYAQPQDDWNRTPLDYGHAAQAPGYDQYDRYDRYDQYGGASQGTPTQGQYYASQTRQVPQQSPQDQPQQPQQQPRVPQNPYFRQQPEHGQAQAQGQAQSQTQGYGYDTGSYAPGRAQQQYPAGQGQPRADYADYGRSGYDTGSSSYSRQGYDTPAGYDNAGYDTSGGYATGTGHRTGGGYAQGQPGYEPGSGYEQSGYASGGYDTSSSPRGRRGVPGPAGAGDGYAERRDPYTDLAELADEPDEYEYPGRGGRRRATEDDTRGDRAARGARGETGTAAATTGRQARVDDEGRLGLLDREDAEDAGDEDDVEGGRKRGGREGGKGKKNPRRSCLVIFLFFALLAGGLGYGGYQGYNWYQSHYGPPPDYSSSTGDSETVLVNIPSNVTGSQIGAILYQAGVVESQRAFTDACNANPQCGNIQANEYQLHKQMSAAAAVTALLDTHNVYNKAQLLVRPGERAADVFADLEKKTGWTQAQILAAIGSGQIDLPSYATAKPGQKFPFANVEGLLYTGTYQLPDFKTPTALLKSMIDQQLAMFQAVGLDDKAKALNLTPYQVLTVASMARAEAGTDQSDLSKISGVIYNRLKNTQEFAHLGFDTTTLYGMGNTTTVPDNADSSNPYNTSVHGIKGLPPGPIDSVDQQSLTAAMSPDDATDLFFCAVDGKVLYAQTDADWKKLGRQHPNLCGD